MLEIGLLVADEAALMHVALVQEAVRIANRLDEHIVLRVRIYCPQDQSVRTSSGQLIWPTHAIDHETLPDALFVIVSLHPQQVYHASVEPLLTRFSHTGKLLGAIDCGACFLARNHLLGNRKVTVHWEYAAAFAELYPQVNVCTDALVKSDHLITCSGGLAVGEMMTTTIAHLYSNKLAKRLAQVLNYSRLEIQPDQADGYIKRLPSSLVDTDVVEQALQIMRQNMVTPLSAQQLVDKLPVSQRSLLRYFRAQGMTSPMAEYLHLRLQLAKQLFEDSNMSIQQVAYATGFSSAAHLSKAFLDHFGQRPGAVRRSA